MEALEWKDVELDMFAKRNWYPGTKAWKQCGDGHEIKPRKAAE
jgi:hypothetical protein